MADTILALTIEARDDGTRHDVACDMGDVYVWERTNRRSRSMSDLDRPGAQDMYELGHVAARRMGIVIGSLDDFGRAYVVEPAADQGDVGAAEDPTPADRSTGS